MTTREGQQLGSYRLINRLGTGSFGTVYLGEHVYLGTPAAIKVMNTELPPQVESPFRAEARTLARLIHPYIVRILDFGIAGATPFLVLDYAPNGTLRDRYPRSTRLPLSLIATYVRQIADALTYAHEQQLVHRDIKPENILLGRQEEALLSDFGIAIMVDPAYASPSDEFAGTLAYCAPEQLRGLPQPASDQYALAAMTYEWIAGVRPFEGSTPEELARKQLTATPQSLREKVPSLSSFVEQVVLKALEKDPQQRYPTVNEFAQALELAIQQEANLFSAPTLLEPLPLVRSMDGSQSSSVLTTFQKTKEEWLAIGNGLYDARDYEEALLAYERAIVIDPNYAPAYIGKGIALRNLKRYDEAILAYDRAMQLAPTDPTAYNNKSLTLNDLGRFRESLIFSQRALELQADYPAAYFNMGYALGELQRYEEEIAAYDRTIELAPNYAPAYNAKGVALNALKRYDEALVAFEKALTLDPQMAVAYANKGYTLNQMQRPAEALSAYQRALMLNPTYANAYQGISIALERLGRSEEAEEARRKARALQQ